jgi:hypothetical protein
MLNRANPLNSKAQRLLEVLIALLFLASIVYSLIAGPSLRTGVSLVVSGALVVLVDKCRRRWIDEEHEWINVDAQRIWRGRGLQTYESLRWDELTQVTIMTTDDGPFVEDLFWLLRGDADDRGIVVGLGLAQQVDLLGRLGRLPGFNFMASVEATGSTQRGQLHCWSGQPGQGRVCGLEELGQDGHLEAPL